MHRASTVLALSLPVCAQGLVLGETHAALPRDHSFTSHVASGDVDGDGFVDHLFAANVALLGRVDGGFTVRRAVFSPAPQFDWYGPRLTLADVDGDGDLDACVPEPGSSIGPMFVGGRIHLYVNDGLGTFADAGTVGGSGVYPGHSPTDVAAADVDGDGDLDLAVAVRPDVYPVSNGLWLPPSWYATGGQNRLWLNQGGATFVDATNRLPGDGDFTTSVALVDLDGDGDRDIYFGNAQSIAMAGFANQDRVLHNQGNGWFVDDQTFQPGPTNTSAVYARDFDADGDVDVLLHDTLQPRFLRNDGTGTFTVVVPPLPMPTHSALLVGDFDADGFVDFGVRTTTQWQPVRNVAGVFVPVPAANEPVVPTGGLLADLERDGDLDLLLSPTASIRARWLRNTGGVPHRTVASDPPEAETRGRSLAVGDIDGDGDLDLVLAAFGWPGTCYRNDGHGSFAPVAAGAFTQASTDAVCVQLADLDGDGDLDAAVGTTANGSTPNVILYWNQGGVLTQQVLSGPANSQIAVGDLDGDGDLDLYCSPWSGTDVVLTNHGGGTFTAAAAAVPSGTWTRVPRLADIDADGDLDVVGSSAVLRNGGTGVFTLVTTTGAYPGTLPLVGDFDGDQDVDFVLGATMFRNDGNGAFTPAAVGLPQPPTSGPRSCAAGDFDRDGDLDVLLAFAGPAMPAALYTNDGAGSFTLVPGGADDAPTYAADIDVADLDGDGDLDAVLVTGGPPRIWWNRTRHLSWRELPRVGWPLVLDLEGRANDPCALALAFAPTSLPISPFGTLRLDPASLFLVAIGALDGAGAATFQQMVPPVPALVGWTLYWQTLSGSPLRLGNLERTTFLAQ